MKEDNTPNQSNNESFLTYYSNHFISMFYPLYLPNSKIQYQIFGVFFVFATLFVYFLITADLILRPRNIIGVYLLYFNIIFMTWLYLYPVYTFFKLKLFKSNYN